MDQKAYCLFSLDYLTISMPGCIVIVDCDGDEGDEREREVEKKNGAGFGLFLLFVFSIREKTVCEI